MGKQDLRTLSIKTNVVIEEIDRKTKQVKKRDEYHNLVVNDGLQRVADLIGGLSSPTSFSHIALGTDGTAPAVGQTVLGTEVIREAATITSPGANQVRFEKVFSVGSGVSHNVQEVGIFDGATVSGTTMFARVTTNNTLDADTDLSVKMTYTIS